MSEDERLADERLRDAERLDMLARLSAVARAARGYRSCVRECHDCCSWEGDCVDCAIGALMPGDLGEE